MGKMDEIILVIPRAMLFDHERLSFQGVLQDLAHIAELLERLECGMQCMRRGDVEENPAFKQPIPYLVLRQGEAVFCYQRLQGGGEKRLHDKLSIGIGGHMNALATAPPRFVHTLMANLKRELQEELVLSEMPHSYHIRGLINDDSDAVGQVHLGILLEAHLPPTAQVAVRETDQLAGQWVPLAALTDPDAYERLENWSKLALTALVNA